MATTYDNASLVMIPSGVKEDKLYSIKPTDGSGDFTFSRGSDIEATRVNSSGLIEKAKVNLLLQSNQFDTTWSNTNSAVTSGQSGYDGTNDAWKLESTSNGVSGSVRQFVTQSGVGTFSVYAKAGNVNFLALYVASTSGAFSLWANLSSGTIGTTGGEIDTNITSVGGDWYRVSLTGLNPNQRVDIYPANTDNSFITASGEYIYIQDAQLNYGLVAQDYVETTTTAVVEGLTADLPRLDYSGGASCPSLLLEPSRTNVLQNSEYFSGSDWINNGVTITDNAAISPEGKTNAALLTGVSGGLGIVKFSTWTATNKVASCFAKAGSGNIFKIANVSAANRYVLFDLSDGTISQESASWTGSIEDFGNGWYRCTAISNNETGTFSLGTTAASDSVYIYGATLEQEYKTSYIPTYGTAAVRGVEQAIKTIGTSYFPSTGFSAFIDIDVTGDTINNFADIYQLGGGSTQFRLETRTNGLIYIQQGNMVTSGDNFNAWGLCPTTAKKLCFTFSPTQVKAYVDGVLSATFDGVYTFSPIDTINFAMQTSSVACKQTLLFGSVLTQSEAIALTTI